MPLSLLTETQRQTLLLILDENHVTTPKERMMKSRILKQLQNTNIIKDISNDLELLNILVNTPPIRPTLLDSLTINYLKLPDCDIDYIVRSVKLLKSKIENAIKNAMKDVSGNVETTGEIIEIINSGEQKGKILRLLSEKLETSLIFEEDKYFTQKEITEELNLPIGTISKHLKVLIEKGLVEREENSSPYRYCCSETTD